MSMMGYEKRFENENLVPYGSEAIFKGNENEVCVRESTFSMHPSKTRVNKPGVIGSSFSK